MQYRDPAGGGKFVGSQSGPDLNDREERDIASISPTSDHLNQGRYDGLTNSQNLTGQGMWIPGAKGLVGTALSKAVPGSITTSREIDIADIDAVRLFVEKNSPITRIVNCAACSQVDLAETAPDDAFRSNALGPEVLGQIAKEIGAQLLHLSSDYVFSGTGRTLWKESDETGPCNIYGATKLEGERRLLAVNPNACILRTSWVFGQGGKNFVTKLLELLQTKDELKLVDDQIGKPTYAPDLVRVILALLGQSGIYHFANAGPTNKYEFALALKEVALSMGMSLRCNTIIPVPTSAFTTLAKRPPCSALDTSKIEAYLNLTPRHWRDGIAEYLHAL